MRRGFTLIELIVVIAIIAILAAIIAPNAFKAIEKAKVARAISDFKTIKTASVSLYADTGKWPDTNWGDTRLKDSGLFIDNGVNWDGPYLEKNPDPHPWGGRYIFESEDEWAKSPTEPANGLTEMLIDFENYCLSGSATGCPVPETSAKRIDEAVDDGNSSWGEFRYSQDTQWLLVWDAFTP
ncbi:MAG: type II secretion system protein GspG [Candidatus Omnitrophica bacterium]|nr:type II secretion system protein GspG [Candidatus Omnitrophota bacterium]MBU2265692.1 type II secretion system protein GspG [Candidatus Omnitrophota bacterium]MBU2474049.1 type II secretion system protein GspG [Candidatus Omnitrophota bacterium]